MKKPYLDLEELLRVPYVDCDSGFQINPTTGVIAFSTNPTGVWQIHTFNPKAVPHEITQITTSPGGKFNPRFTQDGNRLLYLADIDGSETYDIFLFDFQTGVHTNLTPNTPETILAMDWAPDGSRLVYVSDKHGKMDVYLLNLQNMSSDLIFSSPHPAIGVDWSLDGKWIAVTAESTSSDYTTYLISYPSGVAHQLMFHDLPVDAHRTAFSPDSTLMVFCSDYSGSHQLGKYHLETGKINWLTKMQGEVSDPAWSPDGSQLVFLVSEDQLTQLAIIDMQSDSHSILTYSPSLGVCSHPVWMPDGKSILFGFESPCQPPDLWQFNLQDQIFSQLTRSLTPAFSPTDFIQPEHIRYPALDGKSVPALLFKPIRQDLPRPGVIVPHGGPNWLFQFIWYPIFQHMVSRGWIVLAPNYRGSTGYGRDWQLASRYDMGGEDTRDVIAGAHYLINNNLVRTGRIGLTGRSYGGYLTMTCLTQEPRLWACGSAVVPFLNWFTSNKTTRSDLAHWEIENMGDPVENYQLWYDHSPYFFLDRIEAPVQMISGANDPRCPASESIAARDALAAMGKPVELILYPNEGHAFLQVENVIDHEIRRMEFLSHWLDKD